MYVAFFNAPIITPFSFLLSHSEPFFFCFNWDCFKYLFNGENNEKLFSSYLASGKPVITACLLARGLELSTLKDGDWLPIVPLRILSKIFWIAIASAGVNNLLLPVRYLANCLNTSYKLFNIPLTSSVINDGGVLPKSIALL